MSEPYASTVDDHVYVVEAVFEDGDVSEHWNDEQGERCHIKDVIPKLPWHYLHCVEQEFCCEGVDHALKQEHAEADNCRHSGEQEPFELLAFICPRSAQPKDRREQRSECLPLAVSCRANLRLQGTHG